MFLQKSIKFDRVNKHYKREIIIDKPFGFLIIIERGSFWTNGNIYYCKTQNGAYAGIG